MNHEKLLKNRKGKGAVADAALAKAKTVQTADSNSSASQADRRTVEAEQHLIATVMAQGSQASNLNPGAPAVVAPLQAVHPHEGEKAKDKKPKRPRGTGSSAPEGQELTLPSLGRLAHDVWQEIASLAGVEMPPRTSSEASNAALAAALQVGLSVLQSEAARDAEALQAKNKADAALKKARETARLQEKEMAAKDKELQAALKASHEASAKIAVLEKAGFKLVPALPAPKDEAPEWLVDDSGYHNSGAFMIAAQRYLGGAFGDVFAAELQRHAPKDRLKFGVRVLESAPLAEKFLYDVGDSSFVIGFNEGVKATLPVFAALQGPGFDLAQHTTDPELIRAVGKLERDARREEAKARGEVPEPPTPEPEPEPEDEEEPIPGGSRPVSPNFV
ncbi:unnamed protein product [Cuscuta epithymum]|uniref:Uncharacterized protein n=1 Tax=Cuscuta epithymum TaxID=186058 RepID=A0AAV0ESE9_9ASTE|nr:unnamed protein product [Cuscuta epithymum]